MDSAGIAKILDNTLKKVNTVSETTAAYVADCNKIIDGKSYKDNNYDIIKLFSLDDVIKELNYCTDIFMLAKEGDSILCDCGDKIMKLYFDGVKVIYKGAVGSPAEKDIPSAVKNHKKRCFGTCLIEDPSRHPGQNATGGNDCEPYIVDASWLETYNNAKADAYRVVLKDKSWLACKYMGRITTKDDKVEYDVTDLTKEGAFNIMLDFAKGLYVPQVILDKATRVYAKDDPEVAGEEASMKIFTNTYNNTKGADKYANMDKFDSKIIAWSKFVNEMWEGETQKNNHLVLRPIVVKAICMRESSLGESGNFNSKINIMQSINTGDGGLWWLSKTNPYPYTFYGSSGKSDIVAWTMKSTGEKLENGHVESGLGNFNGENRAYETGVDSKTYFGKASIGETGIENLGESINYITTHSNFPEMGADDNRDVEYKDIVEPGKIVLVTHAQQSTDMSIMSGCFVLTNKDKDERSAVVAYRSKGTAGEKYANEIEVFLNKFGTSYVQ